MESENIEHKTTFIAKPEDLSTRPFLHSLKSNDAPGESADYHVYAGWNAYASRNRHGSSAEDISFSMHGHGWKDHSTVDSLPVVRTDTCQDQSFPEDTSEQVQGRTVDDMVNSPGYDIEVPNCHVLMLCAAMLFSSFVNYVLLSNTRLGIVDFISWYHGHQTVLQL